MVRRKKKPSRLRPLIILAILLVLLLGAYLTVRQWGGPSPDKPIPVIVAEGSTLTTAARALEKAGAVKSATRFLRYARLFGSKDPIRAGEYEVPPKSSAQTILKLLQSGKTLQRFVIVPEGLPSVMVQDRLAAAPLLTGLAPLPPEGSVLPDSYSYQRGETRASVLKRMQAAMTKTLATLWKSRKPGIAVTNPRDAVILASIVEKETGVASERRTVAAVYGNRLRVGMRLQADPTVIYPVSQGRPLGRRILRSELDAVNGYNTYSRAGLPAGPIANPGRASIAAVLDPGKSSALYFVATGNGGHVFADTLEQHNANVQRYYALRRARGEM